MDSEFEKYLIAMDHFNNIEPYIIDFFGYLTRIDYIKK